VWPRFKKDIKVTSLYYGNMRLL